MGVLSHICHGPGGPKMLLNVRYAAQTCYAAASFQPGLPCPYQFPVLYLPLLQLLTSHMFTFTQSRCRSLNRSSPVGSVFPGRSDTSSARRPWTLLPRKGSDKGGDSGPAPLFDPVLRSQLHLRLLALPYRAFLQATVHLLGAQGYQAVAPAEHPRSKGGSNGGWDLEARYAADGDGPHLCVARVKQFGTQPVDLRYVDELRGAALRAGANEALLITLSGFSKPARLAGLSGSLPVRLVDGEALLDGLLGQEIGVRRVAEESGAGKRGDEEWEVDDTYFGLLERRFPEKGAQEQRLAGRRSGGSEAHVPRQAEAPASSAPPALPVHAAPTQTGEPSQGVRVTITVRRSQEGPGRLR